MTGNFIGGLRVSPFALGTNVLGWTVDTTTAKAILDAYVAAGGNTIDTAESYPAWAPGRVGGESEEMIGEWLRTRTDRDDLIIATKVGRRPEGLRRSSIETAVDASLRRLGVDHIDLYYAHFDDPDTPLIETVQTMSDLVDRGKVRHVGISNYSLDRVAEWLAISERDGSHRPVALQQLYSLVERGVEKTTLPLARAEGLGFFPYYVLAKGFLTGKYRPGAEVDSPRSADASSYLDERGIRVLDALDRLAGHHRVPMAAIALAWTAAQPGIAAPVVSARTVEQLGDLQTFPSVSLAESEIELLTERSDPRRDPDPR